MAAHSKAVRNFSGISNRALMLVEFHLEAAGQVPQLPQHANTDIVRGAIVLSVAAMDAYFTRRFVEVLVPYIKANGATPGLVKLLEKAGLNTEQAILIATMDRPFRRIRTLVEAHLAGYTTQRFHAIDELFVCLGIKDLTKHAQAKTKKVHLFTTVQALVDRRNQIVHEGDLNKHGKVCPVAPKRALRQMRALSAFVLAADEIITNASKRRRALECWSDAAHEYAKASTAWPHPAFALGQAEAHLRLGDPSEAQEIIARLEMQHPDLEERWREHIAELKVQAQSTLDINFEAQRRSTRTLAAEKQNGLP